MKRLLILALIACTLASSIARADEGDPYSYRHTLHVSAGQRKLSFEAPAGMCFLDQSEPFENAVYSGFKSVVEEEHDQVLLAVFADCDGISGLRGAGSTNDVPLNAGTISWMNPSVGETTTLSRAEYLDMRSSSFQAYAKNDYVAIKMDHFESTPLRTANGVSIGMSGVLKTGGGYDKSPSNAVLGTTVLRHIPIQIALRSTQQKPESLDSLHQLIDKLMAQQIALNE